MSKTSLGARATDAAAIVGTLGVTVAAARASWRDLSSVGQTTGMADISWVAPVAVNGLGLIAAVVVLPAGQPLGWGILAVPVEVRDDPCW